MSDSNEPVVNVTLDDLFNLTPSGPQSTAISNNLYGINHRQTASPVPINKDQYGLTFFTRPQLNLSAANLRNVRLFTPLLTQNPTSYQRVIRCLLDPRLLHGNGDNEVLTCPFVDNSQAFIPLLTNHLTSLSGWPDIEVPVFTAKEGAYKEGYAMVDGITVNHTTYDVTANFRNSRGDPITNFFYYWSHYMSNVFEGMLLPYTDYIVENMIDYNTRIYRLVLDESKSKVQSIAACGASFPTAVSIGGKFDFSIEKPYNEANKEISIPFKCMGAIYNDDILIFEFNKTVEIFNSEMRDENRDSVMLNIPQDLLSLFNNRGYPRINPDDYSLEWWISKEQYQSKLQAAAQLDKDLGLYL